MTARENGEVPGAEQSVRPRERLHKVHRSDGRVEWLTGKQRDALNTNKHERKLAQERRARQLGIAGIAMGAILAVSITWFVLTPLTVAEYPVTTGTADTADTVRPINESKTLPVPASVETRSSEVDSAPSVTDAEGESTAESLAAPRDNHGSDVAYTTAAVQAPAAATRDDPAVMTDSDHAAIQDLLTRWAGCWSSQNVDCYLAAYAPLFTPTNPTTELDTWRDLRVKRIAAPAWIEVSISNLTIQQVNRDLAQAHFLQHYRNPGYDDRGYKLMTVIRIGDSWQILLEEVDK